MINAQESSGIYERLGLGLLWKEALPKALKLSEWKEIVLEIAS
jgi:hypothetical protein